MPPRLDPADHLARVGVEDYVAGRSDRLGRDLLLDARPEACGDPGPALRGALPAGRGIDLRGLARAVAAARPDTVWLYTRGETPDQMDDRVHLEALASLAARSGAVVVLVEDPDGDARALGLCAAPDTADSADAADTAETAATVDRAGTHRESRGAR